jgi:hypothetical protein
MSQNLTLEQRRSAVLEAASKIDQVASLAMSHFTNAGSMAAELQVAQAMADLRAMLTPEVMQPIMALMDTDLGFRTDRDPRQTNQKTGQPNTPYPVEVVKDVVIEAKLRGFHTIGNEFNIISGRFYAAKSGFRRKLSDGKSFPGLSNFKDSYDVPRNVAEKGAIVKCRAEWTLNGKRDSVECEFAIKVNAFMGADAILGKAERKLCKRVHDLISGVHTPDSEIGEAEEVEVVNQSRVSAPPSIPDPTPTQTAQPVVDAKPEPSAPLTNDRFAELESLIAGTCATFDDFVAVMTSNSVWKPFVDGVASVPDMKSEHVERVLTKRGFLSKALAAVVAERKGGSV